MRMTNQQRIETTLRAALLIKDASELIGCCDDLIISETLISIEEKISNWRKVIEARRKHEANP